MGELHGRGGRGLPQLARCLGWGLAHASSSCEPSSWCVVAMPRRRGVVGCVHKSISRNILDVTAVGSFVRFRTCNGFDDRNYARLAEARAGAPAAGTSQCHDHEVAVCARPGRLRLFPIADQRRIARPAAGLALRSSAAALPHGCAASRGRPSRRHANHNIWRRVHVQWHGPVVDALLLGPSPRFEWHSLTTLTRLTGGVSKQERLADCGR